MTNAPFFYHGQDPAWVSVTKTHLHLTLVSEADTLISAIFIRGEDDKEEMLIDMERGNTYGHLQYWHGTLPLNPDTSLTHYCFKIMQNSRQWWLSGMGVSPRIPCRDTHFTFSKVPLSSASLMEDSAMPYFGFMHPLRAFFANKDMTNHNCRIDAAHLVNWLDEARVKLPWCNQLSQVNQLDSDNTVPFFTALGGDQETMKLALLMLATYVGTPWLHPETEGALGDNTELSTDYMQQLIKLREQSLSLQKGSLHWLYAEYQHFAFARTHQDETMICLINNSDKAKALTLPLWQLGIDNAVLVEQLTGDEWTAKNGTLTMTIAGKEGLLLKL